MDYRLLETKAMKFDLLGLRIYKTVFLARVVVYNVNKVFYAMNKTSKKQSSA